MNKRKIKAASIASGYMAAIIVGSLALFIISLVNSMILVYMFIAAIAGWLLYGLWLGLYANALRNIPEEKETE